MQFAGWEMPVRFGGIVAESKTVRTGAGLFDISHMGRVEIRGEGAGRLLDRVLSVQASRMRTGRARYNVICDETGGIIDDCIVYRLGEKRFLLVPNASNTDTVLSWLDRWTPGPGGVEIVNLTERTAMVACQGPRAAELLQQITDDDLSKIRPFRAASATVNGEKSYLARTGYTGEDGFEVMLRAESAPGLWSGLVELGASSCGLGARDVLRLEAGLLLHGNDMSTDVNPYEAALERFMDVDREDYVAGGALREIKDSGPSRRIAGFRMVERGIARQGYPILDDERQETIGQVTSGGPSPTLDMNIGLGYVPIRFAEPGTRIRIEIRGRPTVAEITTLPFYQRSRSA